MKAKEYYAKYHDRLTNPDEETAALSDLIKDFWQELLDMIKQRKARTDRACLSIINELNNKYNALCEMFDPPVLRRNGFKLLAYREIGLDPNMKRVSQEEFDRFVQEAKSMAEVPGNEEGDA